MSPAAGRIPAASAAIINVLRMAVLILEIHDEGARRFSRRVSSRAF
jgi:fatty acid-binding protein DegV